MIPGTTGAPGLPGTVLDVDSQNRAGEATAARWIPAPDIANRAMLTSFNALLSKFMAELHG
jgi:hypothetical protein